MLTNILDKDVVTTILVTVMVIIALVLIVGLIVTVTEALENMLGGVCSPKPAATHYLICSEPRRTIPIYYDGGYVCDVDGGTIKVFAGAKCIIVPNGVESTGVGR